MEHMEVSEYGSKKIMEGNLYTYADSSDQFVYDLICVESCYAKQEYLLITVNLTIHEL
jgi:hypothetical protein